jgi:exosortase/archaeosortase family protein
MYTSLIVASVATLLLLPFTLTVNEFLTAIAMQTGASAFIAAFIAPFVTQMVGAVLKYVFGLSVSLSQIYLYVQGGDRAANFLIIWNCIGWQSLILYLFTVLACVPGSYTRMSKIVSFIIGLEGVILVNIIRIVIVVLGFLYIGGISAVLIHEYASTLFVMLWLLAFWQLSHKHLLERVSHQVQSAT